MAFNSDQVLVQPISEAQLRTYYIGFDLGRCRLAEFSDVLLDALVDFAFGYHTGILKQYDRRKLIEAAKSVYNIKSYSDVKWTYVDNDSLLEDDDLKAEDKIKKRGEFGELILHLLLRDYFYTVPLLSKIYFKDSDGMTVHGFDSVHIGPDLKQSAPSLYLGESKIYFRKDGNAGEKGIENLIDDIKTHFKSDFLKRESALISKKQYGFPSIEEYGDLNTKEEYEKFLHQKDYWFEKFAQVSSGQCKLEDFIQSVTIPLVCTYESKLFTTCGHDKHPDFTKEYEAEIRSLQATFHTVLGKIKDEIGEPIKTDLNIILILLPVPSKKELIKTLHQKLYNQQNA